MVKFIDSEYGQEKGDKEMGNCGRTTVKVGKGKEDDKTS